MLRYDPLWETMERKGISQYRLIKYYGFSAGQLNRLKKNSYVSTHTLDVLCTILNCRVEDILEFHLNDVPTPELGIDPSVAIQMSTNAEGPEVETASDEESRTDGGAACRDQDHEL